MVAREKHNGGRESSRDHCCNLSFKSVQLFSRKCHLTINHYTPLAFVCNYGNRTAKAATIKIINLVENDARNIAPKSVQIDSVAEEELSFEYFPVVSLWQSKR